MILFLPVLAVAQDQPTRTVVLSGRITDLNGRAVPYAYVSAVDRGSAVANAEGIFRFSPGAITDSIALRVRRIGFHPLDTSIAAKVDPLASVVLRMRPMAKQLASIEITAPESDYDDYLDRKGFYERLAKKIDGTFFSIHDIEKRNSLTLTGVLRNADGVRVVSRGGRGGKNDYVVGRGRLCALGLVVDGQRVEINNPPIEAIQPRITSIMGGRAVPAVSSGRTTLPGDLSMDEVANPQMLAGIEVYPSASSVPNALQHHASGCGLVVVWTRFK